jgi:multiphosphoryl transfer protein
MSRSFADRELVCRSIAEAGASRNAPPVLPGSEVLSDIIVLDNPHGLHARPAAAIAGAAKKYMSNIRIVLGAREANAKSIVGIIGLGAKFGDSIRVRATGDDAGEAAATLAALIVKGAAEEKAEAAKGDSGHVAAPVAKASVEGALCGVPASPGIAIGTIRKLKHETVDIVEAGANPTDERIRLAEALAEAWSQIDALRASGDAVGAKILEAHQDLLGDPDLMELVEAQLANGKSAPFAWRAAYSAHADTIGGLANAVLRERAGDIRDVGRRVLSLLTGTGTQAIELPPGTILVAEDLTPSDTVAIDRSRVVGFCTTTGGATSHVAILARSLDLPAVCGIDERALDLADGTPAILDGGVGTLKAEPSADETQAARARIERDAERLAQEKTQAHRPAVTRDGHHVEVVANIRNIKDAADAAAAGAEGVGLLRSEFLFDNRETAPGEAEQAAEYAGVAAALGPDRPLVVRTLDVGGDKPLAYLPLPKEDNPFLGLRGIRVGLDRPDLLRTQLRAILQAAGKARLHIMFPMIASIEELREARAMLDEENTGKAEVKVGIMVEVPSAAVMADVLAREADFFSIGTNDLTQYTLAMDRGHPKLAKKADGLHPAVLRMIDLTVKGAHAHGKWVGVCGGMASDPLAVPALVGLGVDELSVSIPAIATIKAAVSRLSRAECAALAQDLLALGTAAEVRQRLSSLTGEG